MVTNHTPLVSTCEFCDEIHNRGQTRFHDIYSTVLSNRVIYSDQDFVVIPSLGQVFPGHLLIIPKLHVETIAQLPPARYLDANRLIKNLQIQLRRYGYVFIFEHGAKSFRGNGCGVYHAHIHLIPLPKAVSCKDLISYPVEFANSLTEAWHMVSRKSEYLVIRDCFTKTFYSTIDGGFGSQYCRRRIAEYFGIENPWDWRMYNSIEDSLVSIVNELVLT